MNYFVFGCEGSGTTWLARALDAYPGMQCLMETRIPLVLDEASQRLAELLEEPGTHRNGPRDAERQSIELRRHRTEALRHWGNAAYAALRRARTRWLGDKHPYYIRVVPCIEELWPDSAWIGIWRHAEATVASNRRRFGTSTPDGLEMWKRHARFLAEAGSRCHLLQYERVVQGGEAHLAACLSHLTGEPAPPDWIPLLPKDTGTPAGQVLGWNERLAIRIDPDVRELTARLRELAWDLPGGAPPGRLAPAAPPPEASAAERLSSGQARDGVPAAAAR